MDHSCSTGVAIERPPTGSCTHKLSFRCILHRIEQFGNDKFVVNIGARDGYAHEPCYDLYQAGYRGVNFEADRRFESQLKRNYAHCPLVQSRIEMVNSTTIAQRLSSEAVPKSLAALKIDIDSLDLPVAKAILDAGFAPKVLMLEINPDIPPPFSFHVTRFRKGNSRLGYGFYGASAQAVYDLASGHGYALLGFENAEHHAEHNAWFVRREYLGKVRRDAIETQEQMEAAFWTTYDYAAQGRCLHTSPCPNMVVRNSSTEQAPLLKWLGVTYGMPKAERIRQLMAQFVGRICYGNKHKDHPAVRTWSDTTGPAARQGENEPGRGSLCGGYWLSGPGLRGEWVEL